MFNWRKYIKDKKWKGERLPYLNRPIDNEEHDWIGMAEYADYLKAAIDRGAEMIAVTAEFGTGKSSLIQLLKKKCKGMCYRIFEVDLWCHLESVYQCKKDRSSDMGEAIQIGSADIHKAFLYQLANQISSRLGDYVSKRMSENYGLLQLRIGHIWLRAVVVAGVICLGAGKVVLETAKLLEEQYKILSGHTGSFSVALSVLGILCLWTVLSHSEIVFSSRDSEGKRSWKELDAGELFHNQILKRRLWGWWKRTVIIIEDLDRSNDMGSVAQFLKEIRKYYLAPRKRHTILKFLNKRITFVVNIKQESCLLDKKMEPKLYPKIFDFILDLKKINIDNYDQILEGLLLEKGNELQRLGLLEGEKEVTGKAVMNIPGIQWMIRGQALDVREVKNRLNTALLLYASLSGKFGKDKISFEKCAVVSYISLAFPEECQQMKDHTLDELMKDYLSGICTEVRDFRERLGGSNNEYAKEIYDLVQGHQIDGGYRTYFYNYPKGSHLRSLEEELVYNVILYPNEIEHPKDLEELIRRVKKNAPEALQEAFDKLKALHISFPNIVLESPELFAYTWKEERENTLELIGELEQGLGIDDAFRILLQLVQFPEIKDYSKKELAEELCKTWNEMYSSSFRRCLRMRLCEKIPEEILLYDNLFRECDAPMNTEEITYLTDVRYILRLMQNTEDAWETECLRLIHQRILKEEPWKTNEEACSRFYLFLMESMGLNGEEVLWFFLGYMKASGRIWESMAEDLLVLLEEHTEYNKEYVELLNQIDLERWTEDMVQSVRRLHLTEGLCENVCNVLWEHEMYPEYLYHMIRGNLDKIAFDLPQVIEAYSRIETDLYNEDESSWFAVRLHLISRYEKELIHYQYLFGGGNPFPTEEEVSKVKDIPAFLLLLNPEEVKAVHTELLVRWFESSYRSSQTAFAILKFICGMLENICREIFFKMDLQVVNYRRMSKKKKTEIREELTTVLALEDPKEALKYMEHTGELDEVLERSIGRELQEDKSLRIQYVDLMNKLRKPSRQTISNIVRMTWLFPYCEEIEEELYQRKVYNKYVSSKILRLGRFEIENEKKDILWPVYLDILRSTAYGNVKTLLALNNGFLRQVMKQKGYQGMYEENRKFFARIYRDSDCLRDAQGYGEEFLDEYLSMISGFEDENAAEEFLEIIKEHPRLIRSEKIYENVHEKLVNPVLKGKYTRLKKVHSKATQK